MFYLDAAKKNIKFEVVPILKERLSMYGSSTSGRKQILVQRLMPLMDAPPPYLGPGSWYHFQKQETMEALKKFCEENHINIKKAGYGCHPPPCSPSPQPLTVTRYLTLHLNCVCSISKLDVYEMVYFRRPKDPDAENEEGEDVVRFKDEAKCLKTFRTYNNVRRRCLLSRAIYGEAKIKDLGITTTEAWKVRSCHPKFEREQVARGLSKIPGVTAEAGRILANLIPRSEYPASIEIIKKHCCRNFCRDCKGAFLYGDFQVKGFVSIPKERGHMITFAQFRNPKKDYCQWRLSKRRLRDEDGNLLAHGWISRCVTCSDKHQLLTVEHNNRKKEIRHRIKCDELTYLRSGQTVKVYIYAHTQAHPLSHPLFHPLHCVQVNFHDFIAWPLFAALRKRIRVSRALGEKTDLLEELRKIAVEVGVGMDSIKRQYETWPTRTLFYRRHLMETRLLKAQGVYRRRAWLAFLAGDGL